MSRIKEAIKHDAKIKKSLSKDDKYRFLLIDSNSAYVENIGE